jgi:transcriptional regulator with XRE-family HTH domain
MSEQREDDDDDDLGIIPNRIKELRKAMDLTAAQLAEQTGYSTGHINNIENLKKGFSRASLKKIAKALGVTPAQLLDTSNAWQEVQIMGFLGDKGIFTPAGNTDKRVKVPLALGDVVALQVEGMGLYPRYNDGATIICAKAPADAKEGVGHECFVVLANGVSMIRNVDRGSSDKLYNLTSHNQPPLLNTEILVCRRVLLVLPPE